MGSIGLSSLESPRVSLAEAIRNQHGMFLVGRREDAAYVPGQAGKFPAVLPDEIPGHDGYEGLVRVEPAPHHDIILIALQGTENLQSPVSSRRSGVRIVDRRVTDALKLEEMHQELDPL